MATAEERFHEAIARFAEVSEGLLAMGATVEAVEEMTFGPLDLPANFPVQLQFHNPQVGV